MSDTILPFQEWPEGIAQASVPANENSLRNEALRRPCLGVSNNVTSPADGDLYIVGDTPTGSFSTFTANDLAFARVSDAGESWYAWAPTNGLRVWMDDGSQMVYVGESTNDWVNDPTSGDVASVNGNTGIVIVPVPIGIACSDETTALTTGSAKVTFRMPFAMTLQSVRASLGVAQTLGSIVTIDINEAGASILSTKITIDNGEKTSTTAATAPVISDSALTDDSEITIDIDQIGDGTAKGLKVWLIGYPS